jgi:hypothetical protein
MKHLTRTIKHIHRELWHTHLFDYTYIVIVSVIYVLAMRLFTGYRSMQLFVILAFVLMYIVWGIYHHIITKTFRLRILLEYLLIGATILFFSFTLIL